MPTVFCYIDSRPPRKSNWDHSLFLLFVPHLYCEPWIQWLTCDLDFLFFPPMSDSVITFNLQNSCTIFFKNRTLGFFFLCLLQIKFACPLLSLPLASPIYLPCPFSNAWPLFLWLLLLCLYINAKIYKYTLLSLFSLACICLIWGLTTWY